MKQLKFNSKVNKYFHSRFDILGSYTGSGMGYSEPEADMDDL